ncbi:hypothetical protein PG995_005453 [Apiospora arundinis]
MSGDEAKTTYATRGPANVHGSPSAAHDDRPANSDLQGAAAAAAPTKKSRRPSDVTQNACNECKKKRAKCDGNSPCARCSERGVARCHYELPLRQSKDSLRNEIDQLKRRLYHNECVLSGLKNPELYDEVLARLHGGQSVDVVSKWLQDTVSSEDGVTPASVENGSSPHQSQPSQHLDVTPPRLDWTGKVLDGEMPDEEGLTSFGNQTPSQSAGTGFPRSNDVDYEYGDMDLVQHLLALYFCWEYPTFATIHKEYFLADFLSGRQEYCSATLVNALLALGCLFSSGATPSDESQALSDHFFKEALRLTAQENDQYTLTNIQSMGILAIREVRCGRNTESRYYAGQSMRLALEVDMRQVGNDGDEGSVAVSNTTPPMNADIEAAPWTPYPPEEHIALSGPLQQPHMQASNTQSVFKCFCEISELCHGVAYLLQTPHVPVTGQALLDAYNHYLDWYNGIPAALRLGINYTPSVFVVHIYYRCAIMLLFRPYIRLRIKGSSIVPRDICTEAADAVGGLLRSYSQLYTLRHAPSFLPYLTLISATMHLTAATVEASGSLFAGASSSMLLDDVRRVIATVPLDFADLASVITHMNAQGSVLRPVLNPGVTESLEQGISDLTEMMPFNQSAKEALHTLQQLHALWTNDTTAEIRREAQPVFGSEFHLLAKLTLASGVSLEDAGFTMF